MRLRGSSHVSVETTIELLEIERRDAGSPDPASMNDIQATERRPNNAKGTARHFEMFMVVVDLALIAELLCNTQRDFVHIYMM
mmetsp:Transcript_17133/g.35699  ORF Transcript_17133/g.35699 Transcript_17133/m.35699 type:complete len:83 (-) Transcript_17133:7-255(-)